VGEKVAHGVIKATKNVVDLETDRENKYKYDAVLRALFPKS
jgi:hypothetical protein